MTARQSSRLNRLRPARIKAHWRDYVLYRTPGWLRLPLFWLRYRVAVPARQDAPILVYTMGKVGTITLDHSLRAAGFPLTHSLHRMGWSVPQYPHFSGAERREIFFQRLSCLSAYRWLPRARRLRVVTAVREPIARLLSLYLFAYRWIFDEAVEAAGLDRLVERFPLLFEREFNHPLVPGEFFATEIFGRLGVDVFAQPFPAERGWTVLEKDNVSLLVLKAELPDEMKNAACERWLGRAVPMVRRNTAHDHRYGTIYGEFKRRVRVPRRFAEALYGSRFMHHFYTPEERAEFWRRWEPQLDASLPLPSWVEASLARHHPPVDF